MSGFWKYWVSRLWMVSSIVFSIYSLLDQKIQYDYFNNFPFKKNVTYFQLFIWLVYCTYQEVTQLDFSFFLCFLSAQALIYAAWSSLQQPVLCREETDSRVVWEFRVKSWKPFKSFCLDVVTLVRLGRHSRPFLGMQMTCKSYAHGPTLNPSFSCLNSDKELKLKSSDNEKILTV